MKNTKNIILACFSVFGIIIGCIFLISARYDKEIVFDFEESTQGWTALAGGKVLLTHQESYEGNNALEFRYIIKPGQFAAVGIGNLNLVGIRKFFFWIKTDVPSLLAVVTEENDGSSYNYAFSTQENQWQKIEFSTAAFELDEDSRDENGILDLDQVDGLLIADVTGFFGSNPGPRILWLDDFRLSEEPFTPPDRFSFDNSLDGWFTIFTDIGKVSITHNLENIKQGNGALEYSYELEREKYLAVFTKGLNLSVFEKISFWIKTDEPSVIVIGIKERDRSEYNHFVQTPGNKWIKVEIKPDQFTLSDDSYDENNRLDLVQLDGSVVVLDADNFLGESGLQKFWIDEFRVH